MGFAGAMGGNTSKGMGFAGAMGSSTSNSNTAIMSWIKANGKLVPNSKWEDTTTLNKKTTTSDKQAQGGYGGLGGRTNSTQLYDLSNVKGKTIK